MSKLLLVAAIVLSFQNVFGEEKPGLANETALGYVVTGGNSQSETTSFNEKLTYAWTRDILRLTGHYIQTSGLDQATKSNNQTAENWSANLRFEKVITPAIFNLFLGHGWNGDRFQGIREGHSSDIGAKYFFISNESTKLFSELGYRYTRELLINPAADDVGVGNRIMPEYHYARLYSQIDYSYSKTLALGAWIEYLPSLTSYNDDQRLNYSPYMTSVLTDIFSLKVAYEGRYRYKPAVAGNALTDFTFTTSLIAKF